MQAASSAATLSITLVEAGHRVRGFLRYNSRNDRGTLDWHDQPTVRNGGGLRRPARRRVGGRRSGRRRCHLPSRREIAIPYSYVNARDFFETNVLGTLNVAEAALRVGVRRLVQVSTSEVYGTAEFVPMTEDHPLHAQSPYAASKIGGDKLIESFRSRDELPMTIVRPFNTYGPHQSARAVIPTIITQALTGSSIRLGGVDARRDLTFVSDTVAGFVASAASAATVGRTLQLGTGTDASISEIVQLVGECLGRRLDIVFDAVRVRPAHSEVDRLLSDPQLARKLIGWRPAVGLRWGSRRPSIGSESTRSTTVLGST